ATSPTRGSDTTSPAGRPSSGRSSPRTFARCAPWTRRPDGASSRAGSRPGSGEDPRWRGVADALAAAGLAPVPLAVDFGGLRTERLLDLDVGAVAVTPAHQYPTGVVLGAERRAALIL